MFIMAKLYMFGTLALILAVFVAARNTYQNDDAIIGEEIDALARALLDPLKRTETSVASDEDGDVNGDDQHDSGEDEDSERVHKDLETDQMMHLDFDLQHSPETFSLRSLEDCMDICKVNEPEELCNCTNIECVPEDCPSQREVGDVDEDNDGDLDKEDGEKRILGALKRFFGGKRKRYFRYRRHYRYRYGKK